MILNEPKVLLNQLQKISQVDLNIIERFVFEYSPETNLLGEWKGNIRPDDYVTATDIAIFCRNSTGKRYVFLIEVKFTEDKFSQCGGYKANGNEKELRLVCKNRSELFKRRDKCYLQLGTRGKSPRKYFDCFGDLATEFPGGDEHTACPFQKNHQCLRNHAFARALVDEYYCDKTYFGLVYHDKNKFIEEEWNNRADC